MATMIGTMRGRWLCGAAFLGTLACQPAEDPRVDTVHGVLISDEVHNDGTQGFFFLPPIVPGPALFGENIVGLWPTVNIEQFDPIGGGFIQPIATFTQTEGPFGETLQQQSGNFLARWKTGLADVAAGNFYRIRVLAEGHQLGFADVQVVGTRRELRNVDTDEFVPLQEDGTLQIKFRIARAAVDRDQDGALDWTDNCPTVPNPAQTDAVGNGIGDACRCPTGDDACPASPRLYALMNGSLGYVAPAPAAIEVVSLATMSRVHSIPVGDRYPTSLAVSADGHRAWIADLLNGEVAAYDTVLGTPLGTVPVAGAYDIALSPDESRLFVAGFDSVAVIDAATNTLIEALDVTPASALAVAIDATGSRLATVMTTGGSDPRVVVYDVSAGLTPLHDISITSNVGGCDAFPNDVVFVNADLALVWDSNCDALYQLDAASGTQLATTVATGRDVGSSFNSNNALLYSPALGRALVVKESHQVVSIDPVATGFSIASSFTDVPFAIAATPDGLSTFVSVIHQVFNGGSDSLDRIDNVTSATERSLYLFSVPTQFVRDMRIVP